MRPIAWVWLTVFAAAGMLALLVAPASVDDRMTREEMTRRASQSPTPDSFYYYFSDTELQWVAENVEPYNCVAGNVSSEEMQYRCGVDSILVNDEGYFIPEGYMYGFAKYQDGQLVGMRILKVASLCEARARIAPVQGPSSPSHLGTCE